MIRVRPATPSDARDLMAVRFAVKENVLTSSRAAELGIDAGAIADMLGKGQPPSHVCFCAEDGDTVVGFSMGDLRDGSVYALFVRPEHEGKGVGARLMAPLVAALRDAGHATLTLTTERDTRAFGFYARRGWVERGSNDLGEAVMTLPGQDVSRFDEARRSRLRLVRPDGRFEASYRAYLDELGDEERYPFPMDFDPQDFDAMLRRIERFERGVDLPDGYVPSSTFWLVDGQDLLGVSNLRHRLNSGLRACGGHIGLGIRPSRRGEGLGIELLARTIEQARARGIGDVHIHCHAGNEASARMIRRVGGVLQSEHVPPDGARTVLRFVVAHPNARP
ncbi:GNAT family N-acetyltransferase [Halomonas denitrificans]|nr:GNAT family N-acetyltransferase [Halomonas denitrificans]